jgi:hypothetical protein
LYERDEREQKEKMMTEAILFSEMMISTDLVSLLSSLDLTLSLVFSPGHVLSHGAHSLAEYKTSNRDIIIPTGYRRVMRIHDEYQSMRVKQETRKDLNGHQRMKSEYKELYPRDKQLRQERMSSCFSIT